LLRNITPPLYIIFIMRPYVVFIALLAAGIVAAGCDGGRKLNRPGLTVAAPDFLEGILDRAAKQFEVENDIPVQIIYDTPDSVIIRSKNGYRVDLFFAADPRRFRAMKNDTALMHGGYTCVFRMSMVLAGRSGGPRADKFDDIRKGEFKRVVIVDPAAGYEGRLAADILKKRRLYNRLRNKLVQARSTEQLLSYMNTGEADAAIVFESSLHDRPGFVVMERLDNLLEERLIICGAVTAYSNNTPSAQALLDLLDSRLCPIYDVRGIYRAAD